MAVFLLSIIRRCGKLNSNRGTDRPAAITISDRCELCHHQNLSSSSEAARTRPKTNSLLSSLSDYQRISLKFVLSPLSLKSPRDPSGWRDDRSGRSCKARRQALRLERHPSVKSQVFTQMPELAVAYQKFIRNQFKKSLIFSKNFCK